MDVRTGEGTLVGPTDMDSQVLSILGAANPFAVHSTWAGWVYRIECCSSKAVSFYVGGSNAVRTYAPSCICMRLSMPRQPPPPFDATAIYFERPRPCVWLRPFRRPCCYRRRICSSTLAQHGAKALLLCTSSYVAYRACSERIFCNAAVLRMS
jgi:hypothetical protein